MRFIYQVLLGLIVFNGMLIISGIFISGGQESGAVDVTSDEDYTRFGDMNNSNFLMDLLFGNTGQGGLISAITILTGSGLISWVTKSPIPFGIGAFLGIVTLLYVNAVSVVIGMGSGFGSSIYGNALTMLITIIGVAIGLLSAFTISEAFMQQSGAN